MKKIVLISILSLSFVATFAAKSNKISDKLKTQAHGKMLPPVNLSYTTSCGTTVTFTISSENMSNVGFAIDYYNDRDCGTHWTLDDIINCPCS
ncbi:hypothetical protein [Ferruginibacter sp. SUN106]|uniref:hypothetical protein n=1 Tax=Ferruginibacter sp. SUN106 TaxID=2978348 RepID=UPI003D36B48E